MIKKYDVLIIDVSNLYYRSFYSCQSRGFTSKTLYQKTIEQTLKSLNNLEIKYGWEWNKVYLLFDNPTSRSNLRSEISSEYKANRKKMPKMFYDYLNYLKTLLLSYSSDYKVVFAQMLEADDLVQPIIEILDPKDSIMLVSADLDWSRSIYHNERDIVWYNFKKIFDKDEFKIEFGFPPTIDKIILYKCLTGDDSDGIKKVVRQLSNENIKQLCNDFNTVEEVYVNVNSIKYLTQTFKYRIQENIEGLRINKKLIEYINIKSFGNIESFIHDCSFKASELKLFYTGLKIDEKFDTRLEEKFEKKYKTNSTSLFKADKLPRK